MKIKLSIGTEAGSLTIQREEGDPKAKASGFTKSVHGWGAEINLLYLLKKKLNALGFKLCRKKVQEDGHMSGDQHMCYLRTPHNQLRRRTVVSYPYMYIIDEQYAIRSSAEDYNNWKEVYLTIHGNVFNSCPQPDWYKKVKDLCDKAGIECELYDDAKVTSV